jgi:drug/metabolite transporter (DMT)-like permease
MPLENRRLVGTALVLLSAFAWSLNGLYVRFLTVDVWTTLTGRGIATSTMLLAALLVTRRGETGRLLLHTAGRGWIVIVAAAICMMTFVSALFFTTVANVTVIYAASPLMAAVLARFLIGDRLVARTIVAFTVALVGIVIMVGASLGTGRLFGDFLALLRRHSPS